MASKIEGKKGMLAEKITANSLYKVVETSLFKTNVHGIKIRSAG